MLARVSLLLVALAAANALQYGSVISNLGCDNFDIVMPNPNLFPPYDNTYYYVYKNNGNFGFSSGEVYTNSLSQFMNVADNNGFLTWTIQPGGSWSPSTGQLTMPITMYSDAARTHLIGEGQFVSNDFFAHNTTDPNAPKKWVVCVGGNVTLSYDLTIPARPPASGFSTTVWTNRSVQILFQPDQNMWANEGVETFTNRMFSRSEITNFAAPLFDTVGTEGWWANSPSTPMRAYTADYQYVIQLWGSNGYDFSQQTFTNPNVGMDVAMGLICSGNTPSNHVTPPPPNCPVPSCATCTKTSTVSGLCGTSPVDATSDTTNCIVLNVDNTVPCSNGR